MTTKWDVLTARQAKAQREADRIAAEMRGMDNTPFSDGTKTCQTCGEPLRTEGEFARHYRIDDVRYLNLGWCPKHARYALDEWRLATNQEEADYLAGYVSSVGYWETEDGLLIRV